MHASVIDGNLLAAQLRDQLEGVGPVTDVWLLNSTVAAARPAAGLDSDRPLFDVIRTRSA
jgi:hypothetical protein